MNRRHVHRVGVVVVLLAADSLAVAPAQAAETGGGLLSPFNVLTGDGVPLDRYQLTGGGESPVEDATKFLMGGLFALARTLVGAACWLIDWAYRFPVLAQLTGPAQRISDAYQQHVLAALGLGGLLFAWAFVFGLIMVIRGRPGRGFGEILLTLLISAVAATGLVRPDVLLGPNGPLRQAESAAAEAAVITARSGGLEHSPVTGPCALVTGPAQQVCVDHQNKEGPDRNSPKGEDPCDLVSGPARDECRAGRRSPAAAEVSGPLTRILTDTLVVQPYQLLQYGQLVDKDSRMYQTYLKGLGKGALDGTKEKPDACDLIDGPAKRYCIRDGESAADRPGPRLPGKLGAIARLLENDGDAGKAAAAFMSEVSWERVLGALLLLVAAGVVFALVVSMVLALIGAQFGCVLAAVVGCVVLVWALLPGPNRGVLWRWVGTFGAAAVLMFAVAAFIPLFGVAAQALLTGADHTVLVERLVLLDGLAIVGLALHRRMRRSISGLGQRFATRMRFAKVGGSHMLGDDAAATGLALASLGGGAPAVSPGGGLFLGGGRSAGSSAHARLAGRRAALAAGWRAMTTSGNRPGLLAEAGAEARRGLAPLTVAGRAAQLAWTGPPPNHRRAGRDRGPRRDNRLPVVIDGTTGEILSHPDRHPTGPFTPIGIRLQERIGSTRGGRVLLRTGKTLWHSTVGLPAAYTRVREGRTELSRRLARQLDHYELVAAEWRRDTRTGRQDLSRPAREVYERAREGVVGPIRTANNLRREKERWRGEPRYRGGLPQDWFDRYVNEPDPHSPGGEGRTGGRP
ncbi:hypothetical protein [Streptomyces luteireticuli]|uniref:hypothetical protein n=1 Tax=Streptomyces luteireticuli TaxID=173858 RepID=UPI003557F657